jgi:hypothetical protein
MSTEDIQKELDGLPRRIDEAAAKRDQLYHKLRARWSESYLNDQRFMNAYSQAEAAGAEVVWLMARAVKASRIVHERTSGILP